MGGSGVDDEDLRRSLDALADRRHQDPELVYRQVTELARDLPRDHVATAHATWVKGLAAHELNRPDEAASLLRTAMRDAERHGDRHTAAVARASLAISLLATGDAGGAEREIATAVHQAPTSAAGLVGLLDGLVRQRTGRLADALSTYDTALAALRREADDANVARLLLNRGTLLAYQGDFRGAVADLGECESIASRMDLWVLTAMAAHNLGFTEGRRGSVPEALAAFDRAETAYANQGHPPRLVAALWADRCDVFLNVGLTKDAVRAAAEALETLGRDGDATHRGEAMLLSAQALMADGNLIDAREAGRAAAAALRSGRRHAWAALADYLVLQADVLATQDLDRKPPGRMVERAQRISAVLEEHGWPVEALHVRTFLARVAIARGEPEVARRELAGAVGGSARGSARLRAERWHATALLRLTEGDPTGAKRALRQGLDVLDEHRASMTATELRAGAGAKGAELARLGLRLAVAGGRPMEVLRWAEHSRAGALRLPAVRPPDDPEIEGALRSLRELRSAERAAERGAGSGARPVDSQIARLERIVRSRSMAGGPAHGPQSNRTQARLDIPALRSALADATLVELVAVDGRLLGVTVRRRRTALVELADLTEVVSEVRYLQVALRRVLATPSSDPSWPGRREALGATAANLDRLLLEPLGPLGDAIVIVPTGALHGVPWSLLPSARGRQVTVAPSAALWQRERVPRPGPTRTTIVAGPDLPAGHSEVRALRAHHTGAGTLTGSQATSDRVLAAMEASDLLHLAAHGAFRADSPMFSSLRLHDGPLTVYDLERLLAVPETVILPVCDGGVMDVRTGDELIGTASAMLSLGVRLVVAPVVPVPDQATARVMDAVHERLAAGASPQLAVSHLADSHDADPVTQLVAASFVCIGTT